MSNALPEEFRLPCDDGSELVLRPVARMAWEGRDWALLEIASGDEEDEGSVTVVELVEQDGELSFLPMEDDDLADELFYLLQAEADDYEVGPAE